MKTNKLIILLVIIAFVVSFSLVGCGSSETPAPAAEEPAVEAPAAEAPAPAAEAPALKTYVAADPTLQPAVDMIIPNLTAKVKSGDITQERMDEIILQVGDGTLSIEELQAIMAQ